MSGEAGLQGDIYRAWLDEETRAAQTLKQAWLLRYIANGWGLDVWRLDLHI